MIRQLVASLPTPLALLLAGYGDRPNTEWPRLFSLCEMATIYLENVLRAQTDSANGLDRPRAWGNRLRTIRLLTERLHASRQKPILCLDVVGESAFAKWLTARNEWAHSVDHQGHSRRNLIPEEDVLPLVSSTFSPLCLAKLVLAKPKAAGVPECSLLQGLQGLFSPALLESVAVEQFVGPESELFLWREELEPIRLKPYFRYRLGDCGENRVEFLSTFRDGIGTYVDPLPQPHSLPHHPMGNETMGRRTN